MADNIAVTPGLGADVATDDCGAAGHTQVIKLAVATDGSAALVPADADGLKVNVGNASIPVTGTFWQATQPVSGTFWQATQPISGTVTINAVPAGNNNIGDVDVASIAAGNNNIGDVDVASIAAGDNNIGNVDIVTVPTDPFGANGDAGSATGSISAKLRFIASTGIPVTGTVTVGSHAVTNAGVFATQVDGAALTSLQLADDVVVVLGTDTYTEATSKGNIIAAVRRDADTTLVNTTNEYTPLQVDANGRLKVEAFSGETLPVSGTVTETNSGNALTALQLIDDIVYVDDTATHATGTSKGALIMAAAVPTDTSISANDIGAVAMTTDRKLHVAVMDALPAGTAAIGKLAANNGVDIGDVDVASIVPGTAATNLGKAEDAQHASGDVGVMALCVRNDANAAFGVDIDYTPQTCDSGGNLNTMSRKHLVRVSVQSSGLTTASTAYSAGDQMGAQFTIAGCSRASGGTGYITGVCLVSAADIIGAVDVVFTRASITLAADNAAYAISDADALNVVGLVNLAGAYDIGNNRIAQAFNLAIPYDCSGGTSLYAGLITRSGHTFFGAATDLQLIVYVELN